MLASRIARRIGLDRNPLRRASDRFETWLTVVLAAAVLLAGPLLAWRAAEASYRDAARASERDRQQRFRVQAVLLEDSFRHVDVADDGTAPVQGPVPARWTAPEGTAHTGLVVPRAAGRSGSVVMIWTDFHGDVTRPPVLRSPSVSAIAAWLFVALGITAAGLGVRLVVARHLDRRRMYCWQTEWTLVEPLWSGRRWRH
jgi:hypothetical protein